jgi:hypothetical protein
MLKKGLLIGILVCGTGGLAWADASIETGFKTTGFRGMGAAEGTSLSRYQADKKWDATSTRFTGAVLSRLTGGTETITITRVDKGVYWNLDPKSRTYQESPIALPRTKPEEREKGVEKPTVRITRSEFSVKKTGASETINGFPCEEYLITWLLEMEDLETKARSRSTMATNLWTTPETAPIRKVQAEEQRFNQALAKKLGSEITPEEARQLGLAAMAAMSRASQEEIQKGLLRVKEEMAKIKGYPIRTVIHWNLEGEKSDRPGQEEKAESQKSTDLTGGLGGLISGALSRAAKKKVEEKAVSSDEKGAPFFSTAIEVKSLSADAVSAETFEIPAGYSKK